MSESYNQVRDTQGEIDLVQGDAPALHVKRSYGRSEFNIYAAAELAKELDSAAP
jgi:hypothetical protein